MDFDREHYKELKRYWKNEEVFIVSKDLSKEDYYSNYNGFTVAFRPATYLTDNRMLDVAVSYCAPEDKFKNKIGRYCALYKLLELREFVQLPLGQFFREEGPEATLDALGYIFNV
jgi:hypothetical protein